jgi:hypothetical protein
MRNTTTSTQKQSDCTWAWNFWRHCVSSENWESQIWSWKIFVCCLLYSLVMEKKLKQRQSAMSLCFCNLDHTFFILDSMLSIIFIINKGRRDCMIVGFTTTYLCLKWGQVKNLCHWPKLHNGGPKILTKFYS